MQSISKETEQLSFDDFLGTDINFFNKDVNTAGLHKKREQAIEHIDDCECFDCFKRRLLS